MDEKYSAAGKNEIKETTEITATGETSEIEELGEIDEDPFSALFAQVIRDKVADDGDEDDEDEDEDDKHHKHDKDYRDGEDKGYDENDEDNEDDEDDEYSEENNRTKMELYDWMQCIVSAIICGIFIFVFVGRTIGVEGNSMLQTLHWNDRVIMTGLFYTPKNGDIVIFRPPSDAFGATPLVKRVIAVEGQTIDINFETGEVFVDGIVIDEAHYINEPTYSRMNFVGPLTVPDGHVFVMGDNRNYSSDSRDSRVGTVDTRYILGKVLFLLMPGEVDPSQRDWSRIGLVS